MREAGPQHPEASMDDREHSEVIAVGIGGRLELQGEQVRLIKGGIFGHLIELLWLGHGVIEKSIQISQIAAVEIVTPILLPNFIRFSYPGSPSQSGHYLEDALAENALIMNVFDNRKFYELKDRIDQFQRFPAARRGAN